MSRSLSSIALLGGVIFGGLATAAILTFKKTKKPKISLYYFDNNGRAQAIRLAAAYGNYPIEDIRLDHNEFQKLKQTGVLPYEQVPVLRVDDVEWLAQSAAIGRFIGKLTGLYPINDDVLAAKIDGFLDEEKDLFSGLVTLRNRDKNGFESIDENTLAKIRKSLNDNVYPKHFQYLENALLKSPSGWLAGGDGPSIADFVIINRIKWFLEVGLVDGFTSDLIKPFPKLTELIQKYDALPAIQKYHESFKK